MLLPLFVFILAGLAAAAQNPPSTKGLNFYSLEKETALGAHLAEEVTKRGTLLPSAAAREYVEWLGRKLEVQMPEGGPSYTFQCLAESPSALREPNVLPGGYIFVPAGLFLTAESEGEFVGMLAHSMAHAAARHGTRMVTLGQVIFPGNVPLIFIGGWAGLHGTEMALPLAFLRFMRGFEAEADRIAVQTMARVGYDPAALSRYIERMQAGEGPVIYSPRPPREARVAALRQAIAELPPSPYSSGTGQFERIRAAVRALTPRGR